MTLPANPFASKLWIDQPDAAEQIRSAPGLSSEDRSLLEQFHRDGYIRVFLDPAKEPFDELLADVERVWREKPADLLYASGQPFLQPMSMATDEERRPGYRLHELQSHSRAARHFYLHPRLHAIARLILRETPVAIQSILFEWGSSQALHRDPVFVQTTVPGHLLASWMALEDIHADSGPLRYVPQSHRFPPYEFKPGVYRFDPRDVGEKEAREEQEWMQRQMAQRGLEVAPFLAKKGEVFFWHAGLYHGGEAIRDPKRTRKSFVVHYSSIRTHHARAVTILEPTPRGNELRVAGTHRLMKEGRAIGFANPLSKGDVQWIPTVRNRIGAFVDRWRARGD